ncbi:MAG: hydrolase [Dorea sp.]|jgi:cell wall-associated NlpC family hydrolase|nr:hydrolase [Dorea sp.]MCI9248113.1 hydrolase [Dorea sp.]
MRRFGMRILAAVVASSVVVMPVSAAPAVDDLKKEKESAQGEVNSLKAELEKIIGKIDKLERKLIKTGEEIETVTVELGDAKELEKKQYEDMKLRIKYMYEQGDANAIEAIINAKDFTDFMNKAEYIQKVHSYDREKLAEYIATKEKVSNLKTKLENDQKELKGMQTEYEKQEDDLSVMIETKREEVADLDIQLQEAVAAAARKAEEEERARQEAEAKAAAEKEGTNQNNSGTFKDDDGNTGTTSQGSDKKDDVNDGGKEKEETPSESAGGASAASAIVSAAYGQIGVPYVSGGSSSSGFDCSGLVMYCHRAAGISLPHSSGSQGSGGKSVSSPQPGDVVCYAGHVGIYIGGGNMIHAPKPGDSVKIAKVSAVRGGAAWYRRYW